MQFHREMRDSDDNSATSVADASVTTAETVYRTSREIQYSKKLKQHRVSVKTEADTNSVNPTSKYYQKKAIKQEYAKAKRASSNTANASEIASKAAKTAAEKAKQAVSYVANHKGTFVVLGCILALLLTVTSMISSCSVLLQGAVGSLGMTTYTSTEEDMREVEAAYVAMEVELQEKLENYETMYPDYDEYIISGTVLGHDSYVLTSILSAVYGEYTLLDVQSTLNSIFDMQYMLTEEIAVIDDYSICTVTLTCTPLDELVETLLTEEQLERYEIYMTTSGNYPEIFTETEV